MDPAPSPRHRVPFKFVLERLLEPAGYTLTRIIGQVRYFEPAPGSKRRRIAFPVARGKVDPDYVEQIVKVLEEDERRHGLRG